MIVQADAVFTPSIPVTDSGPSDVIVVLWIGLLIGFMVLKSLIWIGGLGLALYSWWKTKQ